MKYESEAGTQGSTLVQAYVKLINNSIICHFNMGPYIISTKIPQFFVDSFVLILMSKL